MKLSKLLTALLAISILGGCATQRPVLYPNNYYKVVGNEQAQKDIDECIRLADDAGTDENRAAMLAKQTGTGAAIGAATGAVAGAIGGGLAKGSLVGAAVGGTVALTSGLFRAAEPSPIYMRFVEACLYEKGYQPLGWQ